MDVDSLKILPIVMVVWSLAHGIRSLGCLRRGRPMVLSFWQGGLTGAGKLLEGRVLLANALLSFASAAVAMLWLVRLLPYQPAMWLIVVLAIPQGFITLAAEHPDPNDPRLTMPQARATERDSAE
jgi:hypothetical protein